MASEACSNVGADMDTYLFFLNSWRRFSLTEDMGETRSSAHVLNPRYQLWC
ncbi:hypothetical protein CNECB9_270005 [Cupriavidus necator]|uniref:Uncharacterized protein n=1 Tax=Cupriavidus necator TaxID=106590 RepID=A0A1K0IFQ9_CUPNE|nr:hypothetical protein CNECB9_270005 [Cupriavidus necator]